MGLYFMMAFIVLVIACSPFVFLIMHLTARQRLSMLERLVRSLGEELGDQSSSLRARIAALEARLGVGKDAAAVEVETPAQVETPVEAEAPVEAPARVEVEPAVEVVAPPDVEVPPGVAVPRAVQPVVMPEAARSSGARTITKANSKEWARQAFGGADWEAVIGGSWLNKLGALVLVVGIGLGLAYSVTHMGPAGRVALGLAVSIGMLVGGVVFERRDQYRIFAQGLLGGGWAGLYFTTYAMHGLEAARIVESPVVGTVLLMVVSVGMIAHSLRYRSETITGLAYFITFATLAISPLSRFALVASVPLAASLLYIAQRFQWERMAVAGLVVSYGSFLLRFNGLQAAGSESVDWAFGQVLLLTYWLIFEAFDLLSLVRGKRDQFALTLFPLNAAGFLGISILEWNEASPTNLFGFFALAGVAYLASALLRARLVESAEVADDAAWDQQLASLSYEGAITVATVLFAVGIHLRFDGWQKTVAWLLEAEMLILSGISLRQKFLRTLGSGVILLPALKVIVVDLAKPEQLEFAGRTLRRGTPVALLTAATLYANRALLRVTKSVKSAQLEHVYTYLASLMLAFIVGYEVPAEYAALGWLTLAVLLLESSLFAPLPELRYQAYVVSVIAWIGILMATAIGIAPTPDRTWTLLVPAAVLTYGAAVRMFLRPSNMDESERQSVFDVTSGAGTFIVGILVWYLAPAAWVAVGWLLLGLLLVEIGFGLQESSLRAWGHTALLVAFGRTFMANFTNVGETAGISHRILTLTPMIGAYYYVASRLHDARERYVLMSGEGALTRAYLYLPAILGAGLIRFELGRTPAAIGWMAMALVLLYVGLRRNIGDFRLQSYLLAALVFVRAWATNFYIGGTILGVPGRVFTGIAITAGLFAAHFLVPRDRDFGVAADANPLDKLIAWFDEKARTGLSLLATILLAAFLFYEVSGSWLTVAWALQGTALLLAGFALHDKQLRISGLVLLGVCILKAFFYDFQELEIIFRIFAFVVLGSLLLAVSFVYSRYKEQIGKSS